MIYTGIARWVLVALAVYILVRCVVSLVRVKAVRQRSRRICISAATGWMRTAMWSCSTSAVSRSRIGENVIGRAASCDIQVADEAISRNHGVLTRTDGTWSLSGSRLEERQLSGGGSDQQGGRDGISDHDTPTAMCCEPD